MPFGLGTSELVVILLIVLLVFGAKRLPDIGSSLGKGIREFKRSFREIEHTIESDQEAPPKPLERTREPEGPKKLSE
ncbi:MAG TPA: twin-arginine translocase TatA/TatE family subunit [Gemmatimonadales bacterium]|jgi:sec-independent protein translocase protein TatA|nr:twin-arginine translocase TatA/TatE family subunit [Gemmatimonadales bacterium]